MPHERQRLQERLANELKDPVRLVHFTQKPSPLVIPGRQPDAGQYKEALQILQELVSLSDKLSLAVHDLKAEPEVATQYGVTRAPATLIAGKTTPAFVFLGAPSGYEFSSLVSMVIRASQGDSGLSQPVRQALKVLPTEVHVQVYVTPT